MVKIILELAKINGPLDAEDSARKFIKKRHFRVKLVLFRTVQKEGNMWFLEGEVRFKWAIFFAPKRSFRLKMKTETAEVVFYEEFRVR